MVADRGIHDCRPHDASRFIRGTGIPTLGDDKSVPDEREMWMMAWALCFVGKPQFAPPRRRPPPAARMEALPGVRLPRRSPGCTTSAGTPSGHLAVTRSLRAGVPLRTAARWGGWKDIATMLRWYESRLPGDDEMAAGRLTDTCAVVAGR